MVCTDYQKLMDSKALRKQKLHHKIFFRARPLKFSEFLPIKPFSPFTVHRSTSNTPQSVDSGLSFSTVTKYPESFYYAREQRTDDRSIFKIPQLPAQQRNPTHKFNGSVESISSGYQSDGSVHIGMANIPRWLKSLRLHKYTWVFENVSYETMLTFTEEYFKSLSITEGAARKLNLCIEKLKSRAEIMNEVAVKLSQSLMFVPDALNEMDAIITSPMKPMRMNSATDVGFQLWKVINLGRYTNQRIYSSSKICQF